MGKSTLLFGTATFAAGLVLGALAGFPPWSSRSPAPAPPSRTPAAGGTAAPVPRAEAPARAPVAPAAPAAPAVVPAGGRGAIAGVVLGNDGAPLAGVLVRATPIEGPLWEVEVRTPDRPAGSPPPPFDEEAAGREFARRLAVRQAGVREATTDAAGAYALAGLPSKVYRMEAWLVGFDVRVDGAWDLVTLSPGVRCNFRASPIDRLLVSVVLPDGGAPEQAVIAWEPKGAGTRGSAEWTPGEPGIEVPPGSYAFTAWAGSPGERLWEGDFAQGPEEGSEAQRAAHYRSPERSATTGDAGAEALELRLEARPGIRATLAYEGARRPRSVRLAALRLEGAASGDPALLLRDEGVRSLWLDDACEGVLAGLEPGTYLVGATFRGGRVAATGTAVVGKGLFPLELRVPDVDPMDWVRVRVLDPDGGTARDVALECGCRGSGASDSVKVIQAPDADGSFRVEHYARGSSIRGSGILGFYGEPLGDGPFTWFVRAESARYGTLVADYDPATDREVTLRFPAPALLRVLVPGSPANPRRERAVLLLEWKGEDDRPLLEASIDASGGARFPPTAPGAYELSLRVARGDGPEERRRAHWAGTLVASLPLTLPSGDTAVSVPLPRYSDLAVTFDGIAPRLQRIGPGGVPDRGQEGERQEGAVVFRDLAEGRYRLSEDRSGAMWVDVPVAGPVAFRPTPFNAYLLEVTGEGYAREIGLRTGDLVVRIEGIEFRDRDSMEKALATALLHGTAKLAIQREGATFEVTANVRKLLEDEGTDAEPWVR